MMQHCCEREQPSGREQTCQWERGGCSWELHCEGMFFVQKAERCFRKAVLADEGLEAGNKKNTAEDERGSEQR